MTEQERRAYRKRVATARLTSLASQPGHCTVVFDRICYSTADGAILFLDVPRERQVARSVAMAAAILAA